MNGIQQRAIVIFYEGNALNKDIVAEISNVLNSNCNAGGSINIAELDSNDLTNLAVRFASATETKKKPLKNQYTGLDMAMIYIMTKFDVAISKGEKAFQTALVSDVLFGNDRELKNALQIINKCEVLALTKSVVERYNITENVLAIVVRVAQSASSMLHE